MVGRLESPKWQYIPLIYQVYIAFWRGQYIYIIPSPRITRTRIFHWLNQHWKPAKLCQSTWSLGGLAANWCELLPGWYSSKRIQCHFPWWLFGSKAKTPKRFLPWIIGSKFEFLLDLRPTHAMGPHVNQKTSAGKPRKLQKIIQYGCFQK